MGMLEGEGEVPEEAVKTAETAETADGAVEVEVETPVVAPNQLTDEDAEGVKVLDESGTTPTTTLGAIKTDDSPSEDNSPREGGVDDAPTEPKVVPLAERSPTQLLKYTTEWLEDGENLQKPPSIEVFVSLALAVANLDKQAADALSALPESATPEQKEAVEAGYKMMQSMLRLNFAQLEKHLVNWQNAKLPKEVLEATDETTAEQAILKPYAQSKTDEEERTRLQQYTDKLVGVSGTTLKAMWHVGDGSSMRTLINFLITGAEGGYGASGWSDNKKEGESDSEVVGHSVFKELLTTGSYELAQTLDRACAAEENNLLRIGWKITEADKKVIESMAREDNMEERKKHMPGILEKLNLFFAEDPDRGKRWQGARSILSEALPDNKGKGKKLPDASGLDLYASVKEEWWKHWK